MAWLIKDINNGEGALIQRSNGENWLLEAKTYCLWCFLKEETQVYLKFGYVDSILISDNGDYAEFWTEEMLY